MSESKTNLLDYFIDEVNDQIETSLKAKKRVCVEFHNVIDVS